MLFFYFVNIGKPGETQETFKVQAKRMSINNNIRKSVHMSTDVIHAHKFTHNVVMRVKWGQL